MQPFKEELKTIIKLGFSSQDYDLLITNYQLLSTIVCVFKPQIVKEFKVFQNQFLDFVELTFAKGDFDKTKDVLSELFEVC